MKYLATIILAFLLTLTSCSLLGSDDETNRPDIPGKIVFSAEDDNGTFQIYTMNANGSGVRQLTSFSDGGAIQPAWSPDGERIAFAGFSGASTLGPILYVMDADGGNMRPLKRRDHPVLKALIGSAPDWSPDGTKIAFQVCTNCELGGGDYEISVVEVAGEELAPGQLQAITDHVAGDTNPAWSPDGNQIAFASDRDYPEGPGTDVYVIDETGRKAGRLTKTGNAGRPFWSSDNNNLIYWSKNNLHNLNLSTMNSVVIPVDIGNSDLGFRPFAAVGNGEYILLHVFNLANPREEESLYVLNIAGNEMTEILINEGFNGADWFIPMNN